MNFQELMDHLVVPRPNGSEGLRETASFIYSTLQAHTSEVELQTFTATPYGTQLLMATTFALVLAFAVAMIRSNYGLALALSVMVCALGLAYGEMLWSPIGGLLPVLEQNIVATFPGKAGGPTLVFGAHYDTATQFGDHYVWGRWIPAVGVGQVVGLILPLAGIWKRRTQRQDLPRTMVMAGSVIVVVPTAAMAWFFAAGPILAKPSPGALDNGGSVAVLLRLAEDMAARPADARTTIKLVLFAGEEEGGLGSWHFAGELEATAQVSVINLDNVGASDQLAYGSQEGYVFRQYPASDLLVDLIDSTERDLGGHPLLAISYPMGSMTDARSFLAHGIPALTLGSTENGQWPRHLHSARDSRDRVSIPELEHARELLKAIVDRVDREPLLAEMSQIEHDE